MAEEMKEKREASKDCFAYRKNSVDGSRDDCRALNDLYCKYGKCRFYKRKGEQ